MVSVPPTLPNAVRDDYFIHVVVPSLIGEDIPRLHVSLTSILYVVGSVQAIAFAAFYLLAPRTRWKKRVCMLTHYSDVRLRFDVAFGPHQSALVWFIGVTGVVFWLCLEGIVEI